MAKLTEYPAAISFDSGDILIKDGTNGTKKISVDDASVNFIEIANQKVDSSLVSTIDDCVLITNDTDGVRKMLVSDISGNAHSRELTYSQYQALSNAEKTNGTTYYVTNDPNDRVGGGVDYSTTEQNTGLKWIDGKPIYQKTFDLTFTTNQLDVDLTALSVDSVVKIDGGVYDLSGSFVPFGYENTVSAYTSTASNIHINNIYSSERQSGHATIWYTKTTDTV